jgi:Protein of unknown function (Hypoth_ymh)
MYNLTESQKSLLRWFVEQVRSANLTEQFHIVWTNTPEKYQIRELKKNPINSPQVTEGGLDALVENKLLLQEKSPSYIRCTLTGRAYETVDSNFAAPDTSFINYLTLLADVTNLDEELKNRCLPILSAGNDSKHWDIAVRQGFLILEERLRSVSGIPTSEKNTSEILVNKAFGDASSLITDSKERTSYRNLYSGVFTVFRNEYGHRFVDPTPEDGGAIITFINLLLKMLEDLRPPSTSSSS